MVSVCILLAQKKIAKIDIIGHTDSRGEPATNRELSIKRADAVKNYLLRKLPQFADLVAADGKGADLPIAGNDTEAGRAKNRRVEIVLTLSEWQQ